MRAILLYHLSPLAIASDGVTECTLDELATRREIALLLPQDHFPRIVSADFYRKTYNETFVAELGIDGETYERLTSSGLLCGNPVKPL